MQHHRQIGTSFVVLEHVLNVSVCRWPRTLAGITAYLPCKRQVSGAGIYSGSSAEDRRAWRRCGRSGQWAEDDYSRCEYMKDVTRVLYIINQVDKCNFASGKAVEPCSILCLILIMHLFFCGLCQKYLILLCLFLFSLKSFFFFFRMSDASESDQCGSDGAAAVGLHRRGTKLL